MVASTGRSLAQNDNLVQLSGIVLQAGSDSIAIPYAHIVNLRNNRGTITDADGIFVFTIQKGDTIQFSSIGYQHQIYVATSSEFLQIELMIDVHSLPEQVVRPMPKTLTALRQAMANLEIKDETDTLIANMEKAGFKAPPVHPTPPPPTILNPLSFFYDKVIQKIQERKKKTKMLDEMPRLE
ncbi:MAG: carboxypeptidase-like regulatory domain-containing protein [Chitinophagales bacterium]